MAKFIIINREITDLNKRIVTNNSRLRNRNLKFQTKFYRNWLISIKLNLNSKGKVQFRIKESTLQNKTVLIFY